MIRIILPLLVLLILSSLDTEAQNLVLNQDKYWDYRQQMLEEYVTVGEGQGKSIPSGGKDDEAHFITWGDATINLGWYLGILATEYHLSRKNAHIRTEAENVIQKEQTLQELFFALKALDRLDLQAEPFFDPNAEPELNGFFMRDDVPQNLKKEFKSTKKHMRSDYESEKPSDNEMSQDQVYHLLMGLMAVHRFIPEPTQYKGMAISAHAHDAAIRIIDWLRFNDWAVVNPVELDKKGRPTKVERGWEAYIFSKGLLNIREQLTGEEEKIKKNLNPLNSLFWSSLRMGINPSYVRDDNTHMAMAIAATGNGFRRVTYRKLSKRAFRTDWHVYPLMNLAMYPENRRHRKDEKMLTLSRAMLDTAPPDEIKSTFPERCESGWSANNRFLRKNNYLTEPPYYSKGLEYAGYDYMLFHNLYLIHTKQLLLESN